jgi:Precorrin-6x reductase CbiJ/CobK/CobB/CobQ-like glutamine amidotransferase domain
VRVGGFGGAAELASWIRSNGIRLLIDATHPFAVNISRNAAAAAASSHVPLLALRRTAWDPREGDRWHEAASLQDAALMLPELGRRHFLTVGRQGVPVFVDVPDAWFLVRAVDPPPEPAPLQRPGVGGPGGFGLGGLGGRKWRRSPDRRRGGCRFQFGYAETTELLLAAGAQVMGFDPLHDESLPPGVSGLLLGGGFPQIHASDVAANTTMRRAIRTFANEGGAISAECAGLLYLGRELDGAPMCGVLPMTARMGPALTLGYRSAVALSDNVLCARGERVTGHEFHRTRVVCDSDLAGPRGAGSDLAGSDLAATGAWAWQEGAGRPVTEGLVRGAVHASYLHVHWAGHPAMATRFVARAAQAA